MYAAMCKETASGNLLYRAGSSARCSVITEVGGSGAWEGDPRGRRYMYTYSCSLHCAAESSTTLQSKFIPFF